MSAADVFRSKFPHAYAKWHPPLFEMGRLLPVRSGYFAVYTGPGQPAYAEGDSQAAAWTNAVERLRKLRR